MSNEDKCFGAVCHEKMEEVFLVVEVTLPCLGVKAMATKRGVVSRWWMAPCEFRIDF